MLYKVIVKYSGEYWTEVEAYSEDEAEYKATQEFYNTEDYPELEIDECDVKLLEE